MKNKPTIQTYLNIIKKAFNVILTCPFEKNPYKTILIPIPSNKNIFNINIIASKKETNIIYLKINIVSDATLEDLLTKENIQIDNPYNYYFGLTEILFSPDTKEVLVHPIIHLIRESGNEKEAVEKAYKLIKNIIEKEINKLVPNAKFYEATSRNICEHFCWSNNKCKNFIKNLINNTLYNVAYGHYFISSLKILCNIENKKTLPEYEYNNSIKDKTEIPYNSWFATKIKSK